MMNNIEKAYFLIAAVMIVVAAVLMISGNHSLKEMTKDVDSLERVILDVTEGNPARGLYESLVFKDQGESTLYTWTRRR